MKKNKTITILASVLTLSASQAATLEGTVSLEKKPLDNIKLIIPSLNKSSISNEKGQFVFEDIEYGQYLLDIKGESDGHYNINISFQEGKPVNVELGSLDYEEIVVTANPLEHNVLKMTTPAAVLSEEDLIMSRSISLEQTLNQVTGVNSGSFGAGAGQIVIRGQQGPRVSVLNNNVALKDASNVSPDHWISSEALLAKQIEVLKGPATLLYGGGAVGGVVNVLDNIIPTQEIEGIQGGLEVRLSDSALNEKATVLSLEAGITHRVMTHFSYFNLETSDYEIPTNAESEVLHDSEGHDENEAEPESSGYLENTSVNSEGYNLGFSIHHDNGYWGLSYTDLDRNYGIPGHAHHEDEDEGGVQEGEESVRIDMQKSIINVRGQHQFDNNDFFKLLKTHFSQTDYQHNELEGGEIGTVFKSDANELRFEITHGSIAGFSGVWGFQTTNRDFSAIGEEAFILPSKTTNYSIFMIEEQEFDNWHSEFGLRFDKQNISTESFADIDDTAFSLSLGATFNLSEKWILPINLTSAQRLPTAEELFSNQSGALDLIPHLATNTIEIGNPDLNHETANNLDIGIRYRNNGLKFNFAAFYNKIDDYIFLQSTGEESEGVPIFNYQQQGATFKGFEADLSYDFNSQNGNIWSYKLFTDTTKATLDNGDNVPRIPAQRMGLNIGLLRGNWAFNLDYVHVTKQNKLADDELPTNAYDSVNFNVNRIFTSESFETLVFFKADNLLNEEIREHASFIKDIAPRPGRSLTAGFRITF